MEAHKVSVCVCSLTGRSQLYLQLPFLFFPPKNLNSLTLPADSGSDEDFLMEDDDDSDYGSSKKKNKKVSKKSKPERKEKKMPKPRLKATGESVQNKLLSLKLRFSFCCSRLGRNLGVRNIHINVEEPKWP